MGGEKRLQVKCSAQETGAFLSLCLWCGQWQLDLGIQSLGQGRGCWSREVQRGQWTEAEEKGAGMWRETAEEDFQEEGGLPPRTDRPHCPPPPRPWMEEDLNGSQRARLGAEPEQVGREAVLVQSEAAVREQGKTGGALKRVQAAHYGTKSGHAPRGSIPASPTNCATLDTSQPL